MQEVNHQQTDPKNPYIQIMFNINSKNVVNNNILSDRQPRINFQLPHQLKQQKIDKTFIYPNKKPAQQSKCKTKKSNTNKSQLSSNKLNTNIMSSQQTCRNKKKSIKSHRNNYTNLNASQIQRSIQKIKPKKKLSAGLLTPNCQQNQIFSSGKKQQKQKQKFKLKIKNNKELRQKVIQLMIKDYEKGKISVKNFKEAISSLIEEQSFNKKNHSKSQIKTQKSKTNFTYSNKNSLGTSLRNTPKNKPNKSKSQKFYHHQKNSQFQPNKQSSQNLVEPKIIERIIDKKQFVNKIIIKGINTSLFLSNEFTEKDSPTKKDTVEVAVINTSDSVRDLKRDMQQTMKRCNVNKRNNLAQQMIVKMNKNDGRFNHIQKNTKQYKKRQQAITKIQSAWKKYKTRKILSNILQQIQSNQQNQLIYSRLNFSDNKQQPSLQSYNPNSSKNIQSLRSHNINQEKSQIYIQASNELKKNQNQFDQFYIRQDFQESQNYSKIQELQKQYALILKDGNDSKYLSDREEGSWYTKEAEDDNNKQASLSNKQNQIKRLKNINNHGNQQKIINPTQNDEQVKFKAYLSSQIQLNSTLKKHLGFENVKQQASQKKANMIKSKQIKKLNQILDIVKQELNKKVKTTNDKENITTNNKNSNPFILQKIAALLQSQRQSLQKQIKIFDHQFKRGSQDEKKVCIQNQEDKQVGNYQVINSFKKKIENKKNKLIKYKQPSQSLSSSHRLQAQDPYQRLQNSPNFQITSFESSSNKSLHSSSIYSNTFQKAKISQLNLQYIQIGLKKRLYNITLKKQQDICNITEKFINDKISAKEYQEEKEIIEKWFKLEAEQLKKTKNKLVSGYKKAKEYLEKDDGIRYSNKLTKEKSLKMIKCISQKYLQKKVSNIDVNNANINAQKQKSKKTIINQKTTKPSPIYSAQYNKITNNSFTYQPQITKQKIQQLQKQLLQIQIRNGLVKVESKVSSEQLSSPVLSLAKSKICNQIQYCNSSGSQVFKNIDSLQGSLVEDEMIRSRPYGEYKQSHEQNGIANNKEKYKNNDFQSQVTPPSQQDLTKIKSQISYFLDKYEQEYMNGDDNQQDQQDQGIDGFKDEQQSDENNEEQQMNYQKNYNYQSDNEAEGEDDEQNIDRQRYAHKIENQFEGLEDEVSEAQIVVNRRRNDINKQQPQQKPDYQQTQQQKQRSLLFSPQRQRLKQQFSQQLKTYQQINLNNGGNKDLNIRQFEQILTPSLQLQRTKQIKNVSSEQIQDLNDYSNDNQEQLQLPGYQQQQNNCLIIQNKNNNKKPNPTYNKLKYLNEEDKDDIFQFMFLDLCLELFLEQTKNNKIMKTIEKHILYLRKKRKIPKGFKTNLNTTKNYIENLIEFIKSNHFIQLKRLQYPMGPSAKEMLKFMRDYNDDSQDEEEDLQTVNLILNINIYEAYDMLPINKLILQPYYEDQQKEESRLKFLNTLKHIHNKAIFDSLNQSLDIQRSYGIWGKPFPWKKTLSLDRKFTQQQLKTKLSKSCQKVIQNCSYLCGVMHDKQDSVFGKSNISDEYLAHIRQDRMSKMLSNDMLDNQDRWIFYDDQQTEVMIQIAKYVSRVLFEEVIGEFRHIGMSFK